MNRALDREGIAAVTHLESRIISSLGLWLRRFKLMRALPMRRRDAYIVPFTWARDQNAVTVTWRNGIIAYCNDCWEPQFPQWIAMLKRHRVETAFFTSRIAGEYLASKLPGMRWHWLPEAMDITRCYPGKSLVERTNDVIQYGRLLPAFRETCEPMFAERGYNYISSPDNTWLFKTYEQLYQTLGDTRLNPCFPKTMTHTTGAFAAGCVETITYRYFESMASRCILFGHAPAELIDLFGYNPVVEMDFTDPAGQVDHILQNIEEYQPLVDRNYERLKEVGTWDVRVKQMLNYLREDGYIF